MLLTIVLVTLWLVTGVVLTIDRANRQAKGRTNEQAFAAAMTGR